MKIYHQSLYSLAFVLAQVADLPDIDNLGTEMATFFQQAIDWGIEAGLMFLGGFAGLVLVFRIFK